MAARKSNSPEHEYCRELFPPPASVISVIFSKGWGMLDDHFLIIEPAQAWAEGINFENWLPDGHNAGLQPDGHSFLYSGIHYLLFFIV